MAGNTQPDNFNNGINVSGISEFFSNVSFGNNVTVSGNLNVLGTLTYAATAYSDIIPNGNTYHLGNTTNRWSILALSADFANGVTIENGLVANGGSTFNGGMTINSNLVSNSQQIVFNSGAASPLGNAAIITVNRGSSANAVLFWDETDTYWRIGTTTSSAQVVKNDASTWGISISGLAATATLATNATNANTANTSTYLGGTGVQANSTQLIIANTIGFSANGSLGSAGQVLTTNGGNTYWSTPASSGVTSVATGNGILGGTITTTGTLYVKANTGIVSNTSGLFFDQTAAYTFTGIETFNANVAIVGNTTAVLSLGNTTSSIVANSTTILVGNTGTNASMNSTVYTGTANNSTNLNGQTASYYLNASNLNAGTVPASQLGNALLVTNNLSDLGSLATAKTNLQLGTAANANIGTSGANVPLLSTINTWGNTQIWFTGNSTVAPMKFVAGTNLTTTANGAVEWDGANLYIHQSGSPATRQTIAYITSTVNTANNATNFNGQPASYYANASNLSSGSVPASQLGNALLVTNNLSDVGSLATTKTNLQMGTAANANIGTSGANVPLLNGVNTWSGVQTFNSNTAFAANVSHANNIVSNPQLQSYQETVVASTITSNAYTMNFNSGNIFDLTLSNTSITITFGTPPASGISYSFTVIAKQNTTSSGVFVWPNTVCWPNGSAPTQTTIANSADIFTFMTINGGTTYVGGLAVGNTTF